MRECKRTRYSESSTSPKSTLVHRWCVYIWVLGVTAGRISVCDVAETVIRWESIAVRSPSKLNQHGAVIMEVGF